MKTRKVIGVLLAVLLLIGSISMMSLTVGAAKTRGDANGDESIDMKDVLLIRKSIANMGVELNEIAADANADESVDMKDVLLIRKFIANMDVELAPMPEESSDTSETSGSDVSETSGSDPTAPTNPSEPTQPSSQVTLTLNIKEEVPRWEQNTPAGAGTYTYERGSTATFKVKVPAYQDLNTEDMTAIRGFVNLTNATLVGDPDIGELGREVEHYYTIIYTYTVQMDDNKTVTGTITSPTFEASVIEVEGSTEPTEPTQPTQPGETTTTTAGTGDVTLNYSIKEEAPRYEENTLTGSKTYARGSTATLTVKVWAYQDLNTEDMTAIRGFVNLTGATLSGNPVIGEIEDHKYPITYTYTVQMNSNVTVTGTIASPVFEPSTVSLDGQAGPTAAPTTTTQVGPTPTSTTQGGQTTTTTAGGGTGDVTLNYSIKEEAPRYTDNTLTGSKTYTRGATATLTVKVWAYQDLNTEDMTAIRGFVNLTGATLSGNPSIGEIEDHKYPITYTYTVQMNSNVTVTGTIASPIFEPSTVSLDGQVGPTVAPTTTTTQVGPTPTSTTQGGQTTTTTTQGGQTTTTTQAVSGDQFKLSLNIAEATDKYNTQTRSESWGVTKNTTATLVVTLPAVYKGNEKTEEDLKGFVSLTANGSPLTPAFTFDKVVDHKCAIFATFSVPMNSDVTVAGTINHPSYATSVITVNGKTGDGGDVRTTPIVLDDDKSIFDIVTLSFNDSTCKSYGVSWQTYKVSATPAVQFVKGVAANDSAFASATTVSATTTTDNDIVYLDYDPTNNWSYSGTASTAEVNEYIHRGTMSGLDFDTTYSYRVGDTTTNTWSQIYTFKTRPENPSDFSFVFLSDSQYSVDNGPLSTQQYNNVLTAATAKAGGNPAFILHGGDIADQNDKIHVWGALYGANSSAFFSKIPTFAAIGNHDRSDSYVNHWNNGGTTAYYSYTYGDVHVIVLNNGPDGLKRDIGSTQLNWLKSDLQSNTAKWTVVTFHRPMYSPLTYDNKEGWQEGGYPELREQLTDLFADYGVDLVLQAHTHQYGRTYPIPGLGEVETSCETATEGGVTYFKDPKGPIYAVIGTAGPGPDPVKGDSEKNYMAKTMDGKAFSFTTVDVTSDSLKVNACYLNGSTTQTYEVYGIKKTK